MNFLQYFLESKDKENWFEKRTKNHIELVKKYAGKISEELFKQAELHDASKFNDPERTPYIEISWDYKCQADNIPNILPENIKETMYGASYHHVKNNKHHPEYWSEQEDVINKVNRDEPLEEIIDSTKMPDEYILEMVCDWCAMSEEKKNFPKDWADKNVGIRWKFTPEQTKLIYKTIDEIWEPSK
jgi:hypothetical protein